MCPPRGRSPAGRARPARRRRPGTRPDANGSLTSSDRDTGRRCHRPGLRRRPSARFPRGRGLSGPRHPPAGMPRPEPARDAVDDACQFQRLSDAVCRLAERPSQQDGFRQGATVSSLKPLHAREGDFRALMARLEAAPITHRKSAPSRGVLPWRFIKGLWSHVAAHPRRPPLSPEGSFAPTRGQSLAALATIGTTRAVRRGVPVQGRRARRDDERRNDGACPQDRPLRCGPHAQPARAASSPQARTVGSTLRDHPGVVPLAGHSHRSPRAHSAATRGHPRHDLGLSARAMFPPAFLYIVALQRIFVGRDRDVRWPGLPPDH